VEISVEESAPAMDQIGVLGVLLQIALDEGAQRDHVVLAAGPDVLQRALGQRAADAAALGAIWKSWLDDPAAARELGERAVRLVEENRGALERTLAMLGASFLSPLSRAGGVRVGEGVRG